MDKNKINNEELNEEVPASEVEIDNEATSAPASDAPAPDSSAPVSEASASEPKEPTLEEKLEDMTDKYLRKIAEFDNYRKRTMKEKADLVLNGAERTVNAFLPVVDDMERALDNAAKSEDIEALREGMNMIFQKLEKTLASLGVKKIDTTDADFNTDFHEAIAMVPGMGEDKKNKVIDCVQTGYMINDKVIRHAKVAVGA